MKKIFVAAAVTVFASALALPAHAERPNYMAQDSFGGAGNALPPAQRIQPAPSLKNSDTPYVLPGKPGPQPQVLPADPNAYSGTANNLHDRIRQDRARRDMPGTPQGLQDNVQIIQRPNRQPSSVDIQSGTVSQAGTQQPAEQREAAEREQQYNAAADAAQKEYNRMQGVLDDMQGGQSRLNQPSRNKNR